MYVGLITLSIFSQCKGVTFLTSRDNISITLIQQSMFVDQTVTEKQIKTTLIHQIFTKSKVTCIDYDHMIMSIPKNEEINKSAVYKYIHKINISQNKLKLLALFSPM